MGVSEMTGGQALAAQLAREGIDIVFGLPGIQLDWAFDALYQARDRIRVVHTRHEQATTYMADGYARTTGKPGTAIVVPGPGLLNAMAGLSTAYACNSPVLCLAGQIDSAWIDRQCGVLHEIPHQLQTARTVTKWAGRAERPQAIPGRIHSAVCQALGGRPRPVVVELPPDVLRDRAPIRLRHAAPVTPAAPDPDAVTQAARLLGRARRPLILAGGGANQPEAAAPLRELARQLEAPVVMTINGKGALSARDYHAQTMLAARELLPHADAVLAVGTRLVEPATEPWGLSGQPLIQLDIDPAEIGRNHRATVEMVADAALGLSALVDAVGRHNHTRASRREELSALQERIDDRLFEVQPTASYALAIREELPDEAIVVVDSTQVGYWSWAGFPVYQPRTYLTAGYQGTLGFAYATALGAKAGNPETPVVSISGDGGFLYTIQELATATRHGLNVVAIVFRDDAYGNVRMIQRRQFAGHVIATELDNPDFVKLAESFGVEGRRATNPEGLRVALRESLAADRPVLIEVPTGEIASVFPILMAGRRKPTWCWTGE
ncbi:MAG TPA: thiamine pyrophosphate-dependent enzyme [Thermomicrobiaceae bacterium]|nr:thiamine pyrophosphate-dependent enzyme [Thermomicrobiaceae bacterium]